MADLLAYIRSGGDKFHVFFFSIDDVVAEQWKDSGVVAHGALQV
jgi:hypothetical protein